MSAFLVVGISYVAAALLALHRVPPERVAAFFSALLFVTAFLSGLAIGWKAAASKIAHTVKCVLLSFALAWVMLNGPSLAAIGR